MFNKILFCSLFLLIFLITWKQDLNAKTSRNAKEVQVDSISIFAWEPPANPKTWKNCKVPTDSIIAAIMRNEEILIDSCEISGSLRLAGDTINGSIQILRSVLNGAVSFADCYFMKKVRFVEDTLKRDINFYEVIFNQDVNFSGSIFRESASFNYSTFRGSTFFSNATFDTSIIFVQSKFLENAWFQHTIFGGDAYFIYTDFGGWVDFLGATFKREVSMLSVEFSNIFISWEQLKGHLVGYPSDHSQFIRKFEENRQFDDADAVYLKMKRSETARMKWNDASKYIGYLMWVTCGYGVMPGYTILWSIGIVIFFAFFYILRFNSIKEIEKELRYPRRPRVLREVRNRFRKRLYDAFYFSVHTFIIGIVSDWYPTDNYLIKMGRIKFCKFRTLSMIEGVLGWVLLVLFVVTLTRKFIR